ncbi:putative quinol monooxygenase [Salinivibrio sharmensis]|uniref:Antibiotic biosynthesis monooxygenase n=1 Tax=Salinivibrio sharmensis TaxID=390883 RepID=A0ABX3KFL3_9GAMM|nr:antibiotic biosynthesis monooxygenase [Salinivibrio sharmensis]OOE87623.1 antibiotic biosynthesis monooxygenase [Salinivibrio sharmensis]
MSKVILEGFILVPDTDLKAVTRELVNHEKLTLEEPGCLAFKVQQHSDNPLRFDVYEEFTDRSAFDKHQERVKSSYWGVVTQNVTRHYQISE